MRRTKQLKTSRVAFRVNQITEKRLSKYCQKAQERPSEAGRKALEAFLDRVEADNGHFKMVP